MATSSKARLDKHEEPLDKHDRQIAAISGLVQEGMRPAVQWRKETLEFRREMRELAAIQKRTDLKLEALIDSLRRGGGNGHAKRRLDV